MKVKSVAATLLLAAIVAGCVSSDESTTPVAPTPPSGFKAVYSPFSAALPFPNDLYFSGSADGTLNMPVANPYDFSNFTVAMNALDGFSTTAPIHVPFSAAIDPATVSAADVIILDSTLGAALSPGVDYSVSVSAAAGGEHVLEVLPLRPLAPKHRFIVIVTRSIDDLDGNTAVPDDVFQTLLDYHSGTLAVLPTELTAINAAVDPLLDAAVGLVGVPDSMNLVTFSFLTQSTSDVMDFVEANATAGTAVVVATGMDTADVSASLSGHADIYTGYLTLPYYLDRSAPTTGRWLTAAGGEVTRYSVGLGAGPAATETLNVPLLLTVPNASSAWGGGGTKPGAGWPLVVFQHGITGDRSQMLAMADAYADAGFAVVAIDLPLHGLPVGHALRVPNVFGNTIYERTFDVDATDNTTGAAGADGLVDGSGQNFINLSSLLTSRDNLRQAAADLIRLVKTAPSISYDGVVGGDFDASRIHFTGHSLGAIVGTTFLAVSSDAQAATLAMPGGTVAHLLRDSATFGPRINAGLAANGVVAGTLLYDQFLQAAQTVVDSGDPINFAAAAAAAHPINLIQVVGDGGASLPDQVVPNSATQRLIDEMALDKVAVTTMDAGGIRGYVNFTAGDHGSILSPAASMAATVQMQTQTAIFSSGYPFAAFGCPCTANGTTIAIANPTVVEP